MIVRFLDGAAAELDDAVAYYEDASPGLGTAFAMEIKNSIERIRRHPTLGNLSVPAPVAIGSTDSRTDWCMPFSRGRS